MRRKWGTYISGYGYTLTNAYNSSLGEENITAARNCGYFLFVQSVTNSAVCTILYFYVHNQLQVTLPLLSLGWGWSSWWPTSSPVIARHLDSSTCRNYQRQTNHVYCMLTRGTTYTILYEILNNVFAINGPWVTRDSVHFSEGWFQHIFCDFNKQNSYSIHLFILHKTIRLLTVVIDYQATWASNKIHFAWAFKTRVRVSRVSKNNWLTSAF